VRFGSWLSKVSSKLRWRGHDVRAHTKAEVTQRPRERCGGQGAARRCSRRAGSARRSRWPKGRRMPGLAGGACAGKSWPSRRVGRHGPAAQFLQEWLPMCVKSYEGEPPPSRPAGVAGVGQ
jgi:hypothetical protein